MVCTGFVADVQRKSNPGVDARGGKRVGAGRPEPPQRRLLPTLGRVGLPLGFLFGRGDERGARVPPACKGGDAFARVFTRSRKGYVVNTTYHTYSACMSFYNLYIYIYIYI
jgi:hypothetical protein